MCHHNRVKVIFFEWQSAFVIKGRDGVVPSHRFPESFRYQNSLLCASELVNDRYHRANAQNIMLRFDIGEVRQNEVAKEVS